MAEKIYLQLDRTVYSTGNIVWFKAIVTSAFDHVPTQFSGVLHVELIGSDEEIYQDKLVKIENGIGQGCFHLDQNLPDGDFLIRAYTKWNRNFGEDFFFEEYIRILPPGLENEKQNPISKITIIKNQSGNTRLAANFNPSLIDSLHKNKLNVFIEIDGRKDSLYIKEDMDDQYSLDYEIPVESQFATLQMETSGKQKFSKTIVLNKDHIDLQFFPESGELVHGLDSRVGFKALDVNGKGILVEGDIVDKNDSIITSFKSNELGMGSFYLSHADSSVRYYGRLKVYPNEDEILLYPLPVVAAQGNTLSVDKYENSMLVTAMSNYLIKDSISLQVSLRGVLIYDIRMPLDEGKISFNINSSNIPEGIVLFRMLDNHFRPVAERLFFHRRAENRLQIDISSKKNVFRQRELTNLEIETHASKDKAVQANVSLLVLNKKQLGEFQQTRQNILSYFLLGSELKGEIENPGHYFRESNIDTFRDLDALLLTQGWRKYNYTRPKGTINFQPEKSLTVSGFVGGALAEKKGQEVDMTLMTFGNNKSVYIQRSDSTGRFSFKLNNEYGKNIDLIIQTKSKSGKKGNFTISIDEHIPPTVKFDVRKTIETPDSIVQIFAMKERERKIVEDAFPLQSGSILIEEVEISSYRRTEARKKVIENYGESDLVIDGNDIQEKEQKWSYGLYSVLLFEFPEQINITRSGDVLIAEVYNGEPTLVVIDGIPVKSYEYNFIPHIPPSEVVSFEIIEYAKNFIGLYCEVFPEKCAKAPAWGNVIAIYTAAEKGLYGAVKPVGIMKTSVPAFSEPMEFYSPKYDKAESVDSKMPDLRAVVHWEPILKTDESGKTSASFYNADVPGEMLVVVEALSENGEIGYQEIIYTVEGDEKDLIIIGK